MHSITHNKAGGFISCHSIAVSKALGAGCLLSCFILSVSPSYVIHFRRLKVLVGGLNIALGANNKDILVTFEAFVAHF